MPKENPSLMVVEDESLLLQAIIKKLDTYKVKTVSCTNGGQAFDYLENLTQLPDLIWLDYHLKDMDGLEFMNKLKMREKWKDIPVVVVSNSASDDKVHNILGLGAKKYIIKAEHRLDDIIKTVLEII